MCSRSREIGSTALLTRRIFTCCICAEIQSISGGLRYPYLPPCAIPAKTLKLGFSEIFGKKSALFAANPAKATSFGHLSGGLLSVCGHLGPRRIPWKVAPLRRVPGPPSSVAVRAPQPSTRPSPHSQQGIAPPSPQRSDQGPTRAPPRGPCASRAGAASGGQTDPAAPSASAASAPASAPAAPSRPVWLLRQLRQVRQLRQLRQIQSLRSQRFRKLGKLRRQAPAPGSSARLRRFWRLWHRAPAAPGALTTSPAG